MQYTVYDEPEKKTPKLLWVIILICIGLLVWWFLKPNDSDESTNTSASNGSDINMKGSCYHYEQLDSTEQRIYRSMYLCCTNFEPDTEIDPSDMEKCEKALHALRNDHPEFFWTGDATITSSSMTGKVSKISFTVPSDARSKSDQMVKTADVILKDAPAAEYDKIKYIYEYIINNTDYNIYAPDNQTAYSALIGKSSVCGGYSNAFLYLCDRAGIYCGYTTGEIIGKEKHAWNFVRINGQYYWVDTTWGDPAYTDYQKGYENIFYDYLCVPDENILPGRVFSSSPGYSDYKSHINFTYPKCSDSSLNYYAKAGTYIETYNRPSFYNAVIFQASDSTKDPIVIKFASEDSFRQALNDLFETDSYWEQIALDLKNLYNMDLTGHEIITIGGHLHHIEIKK